MSEQFQPGDMVECITPDGEEPLLPPVTVGNLYVVAIYHPNCHDRVTDEPNGAGVSLEGRVHPDVCYGAESFRKVYRPSADLIAKLTAEPVLPDAPKPKEKARTEAKAAVPWPATTSPVLKLNTKGSTP